MHACSYGKVVSQTLFLTKHVGGYITFFIAVFAYPPSETVNGGLSNLIWNNNSPDLVIHYLFQYFQFGF